MGETKKKTVTVRTPNRPPCTEGEVTAGEAVHFAAVSAEIMRTPMYAGRKSREAMGAESDTPHIGTLREKRLHAALKTYLCADTSCHERPITRTEPNNIDDTDRANRKERHMVADILVGEDIMEVQTGGLYPLRDKVRWYLANTTYRITVVHPVAAVRYLSWIDPADGTVLSRRRSPKRGRVRDVAKELYWLSEFIGNPRFSVRILLIELEEYRMADGWSRDGKRGSSRYERFPTALYGDVLLSTPADYAAYFLPTSLHAPQEENGSLPPFTAADYAKASGIRGKATYSMLKILLSLGLVQEMEEKIGRSRGYVAMLRQETTNDKRLSADSKR